jgi:hypothetical protein
MGLSTGRRHPPGRRGLHLRWCERPRPQLYCYGQEEVLTMAHASIEEFQLSHDVIDRGGGRRIDGADHDGDASGWL